MSEHISSNYCDKLEGTPVYARVLGQVCTFQIAAFDSPFGPARRGWRRFRGFQSVLAHKEFPKHLIHEVGEDEIAVVHRLKSRPNIQSALEVAAHALGREVAPERTIVFPLAMRVPLAVAPDHGARFVDLVRCERRATRVVVIDGVLVEMRLTITVKTAGEPMAYADAFIGEPHERDDGTPRSFVYTADVRKLPRKSDAQLTRLAAETMDRLFLFASGLAPTYTIDAHAKLQLPKIAIAHRIDAVDDVGFEIRLPRVGGPNPVLGVNAYPYILDDLGEGELDNRLEQIGRRLAG